MTEAMNVPKELASDVKRKRMKKLTPVAVAGKDLSTGVQSELL